MYASSNAANTTLPPVLLLAHKADLMSVERRSLLTTQDILAFVDNNIDWLSVDFLAKSQVCRQRIQAIVEAAVAKIRPLNQKVVLGPFKAY